MSDYALVNNQTNKVENVIHWDGAMPWTAPEGHTLVSIVGQSVGIGFTYENGVFTPPPASKPATPAPTLAELQAQLLTITQQMAALANTANT
jgi:hypothetical protein